MKSQTKKTNLRVAYALTLFGEMFVPIAIWLFFYTKYLDFTQIAVMTAVGTICSIAFEIPTGAFADIVGRKASIVLSYAIFAVTMVITAYSQSFVAFTCLAVAGALSNTLVSGSLESLVYDTLKENDQESEFEKVRVFPSLAT